MSRYRLETDEHGCVRLYDGDMALGYWFTGTQGPVVEALGEMVRLANVGATARVYAEAVEGIRDIARTMPKPPGARRGHEPSCESWAGYACTCQ